MNNYLRGKYAEFLARNYMRLHGFSVVERNYVCGRGTTAGEIDFIAKRGKLLVFVEVKQRSSLEAAAYSISPQQKQRLIRGAQNFLKNNPQFNGFDMRFDAILITLPLTVKHIENAWSA
ncbi:MAG: YraN family protein [Alphaproteobacteria bacterium]|nr:YraN family protein [Alphaproteobacteria bacterium]